MAGDADVSDYLAERAVRERGQFLRMRNRRETIALVRETMFLESLEERLAKVFAKPLVAPRGYASGSTRARGRRVVNMCLSDAHWGSSIDGSEVVGCGYGPQEEARRFARLIAETIEYKTAHRDDSTCRVLVFGDLIHGELKHDPRSGEVLTEQICGAVHLLTQGVERLAAAYPRVDLLFTPGNHGRRISRHAEKPIHGKYDSHETVIAYAVQKACVALKNVSFSIPRTPYFTWNAFGEHGFCCHGDTLMKPGNPGGSINSRALNEFVLKWNADVSRAKRASLFVCGHVHTAAQVRLACGATVLVNGALCPSDPFALSLGERNPTGSAWIFESSPGYIVGDTRCVYVGPDTDRDAGLDKLIRAYEGF